MILAKLIASRRAIPPLHSISRFTSTTLVSTPTALSKLPPPSPAILQPTTASPLTRHVQAWIYDFASSKKLGLAHLDASVFAAPIRNDIMHRVVVWYRAKKRGLVQRHQKTRGEVSGSRRKLRPQKGMGRARIGDRGSPILRGGGAAFACKPRDFSIGCNRKVRNFGLRSALSSKFAQDQLRLVGHNVDSIPTSLRDLSEILDAHGMPIAKARTLLVLGEGDGDISTFKHLKSKNFTVCSHKTAGVYEVLHADYVMLTRSSLQSLEKVYRWY